MLPFMSADTTAQAVDLPLRSLKTQLPVMLVSLAHGSTHWVVATFYLLLPSLSRGLGLNYTETGFLVTSLFIGSVVANLPSGMLVDLTGRRVAIQIASLLLCTVSLAALGFVTGFAALCLCLGLLGVANVMWHPAAISWLSIRLPKNRGYSMSVHSLFANLGDAAGPVAAGWMLLSLSWQRTAEINALVCVACAIALGFFLGRSDRAAGMPRRPSAREYWSGLALLLRSPAQWSFFLMAGCRTLTQTGLLAFLPLYLSHDLGMSPFAMGLAMMALQLGGLVATPFAGVLSDRIGRRPIVLAGMGSTTVVVVALTFVRDPTIYVACISILGFFMYAMRPVIQSWQMDRSPPELVASMTSAMFTVQAVMSASAPIIGGILADRFGLISVFYFLAASVLAANLLCLTIPKTEHGT
jgi:MFS transporter, FSR family, fosmidomycin resistance protein